MKVFNKIVGQIYNGAKETLLRPPMANIAVVSLLNEGNLILLLIIIIIIIFE